MALGIQALFALRVAGSSPARRGDRMRGLERRTGGTPMRRREVLGLMGAVPAFSISALAQPSRRVVKIGHMESGSPSSNPELLMAFQQGLSELGYVEGQDLFIERRYAAGRGEHLPNLAAELVRLGVDVILPLARSRLWRRR